MCAPPTCRCASSRNATHRLPAVTSPLEPAGFHADRDRAGSFGAVADAYDATRPAYPAALIHWLSRDGTGHAVDVGCGTGRVARQLIEAGWNVIGIEPDERMARVARAHGVPVSSEPFEQCTLPRARYELVCAGTAWHWIDPASGYEIAAALLRPGGRMAVFRNTYQYDTELARVFETALLRHAPDLRHDCIALGTTSHEFIEPQLQEALRRSDQFEDITCRWFTHQRQVRLEDWRRELATYSQISLLAAPVRERLLDELVREVAAVAGSALRIVHRTPCVEASRR